MISNDIILARTGINLNEISQGSEEWLRLRLGVITASEVDNILTKSEWTKGKESYLYQLVGEVLSGRSKDITGNPLLWGRSFEAEALNAFSLHTNLSVKKSTIEFKDELMRTACSPDGLTSDGFGVEIKCPYTTEVFVNFALNGVKGMKPEYMAQVQFSMWVTGKNCWHFACYDPRLPSGKNFASIIIERDEDFMNKFDDLIPKFIKRMDAILEEVFGVKFGYQWERGN